MGHVQQISRSDLKLFQSDLENSVSEDSAAFEDVTHEHCEKEVKDLVLLKIGVIQMENITWQ